MTYDIPCDPGTIMGPHVFEFMEPARLTFRDRQGNIYHRSYGVGDKIEVLQPGIRFCIPASTQLDSVPLPDGDEIIEWPADLHMRMITGMVSKWASDLPGR